MKSIIFESHATSLDNEKGIASGQLDSPLSAKGKEQAKDLGLRYKNVDISIVYCSDLRRSFETQVLGYLIFLTFQWNVISMRPKAEHHGFSRG